MPKKTGKKSAKKTSKPLPQRMSVEVKIGSDAVRYDNVSKVHPALKSFMCYCLQKVSLQHKEHLEGALGVLNLHLHTPQLGVLHVIGHGETVSQNEVGENLGIDKTSMVKIIDRLEDTKLIERKQSPKDRRVNFLNITVKGEKVLRQAKEILAAEEKRFLEPLSEAETKMFKDFLYRLLN
jgi:DNA-binding MarR family transcriptional regulator